jgi:Tfp pilus assembly protein PilF
VPLALLALALSVAPAEAQGGRATRAERLVRLGQRYLEAGDRGSAIGYFRDALMSDREHVPAYRALAEAYRSRGDLAEARRVYEAGLSRQPGSEALWTGLVEVLREQDEPDDARAALRSLLRAAPRSLPAWRLRAEMARERGAWVEALTAYRRLRSLAEARGDEETAAEASRFARALALLARPLDPVTAPRGCAGDSEVRRALAGCPRGRAPTGPPAPP